MDNTFLPDPLSEHRRLVDAVAAAGVPPPDEWTALGQRLTDFLALDSAASRPLRDKLIAAVVGGEPNADIPALRAAAHSEEVVGGKVTSTVRHAVLARLVELYGKVAVDNYAKVGEVFDNWADKFATAAAQADPEAEGAAMVDQPDKARKAWLDAEKYAAQLTRLMSALHAAAQLAGVPEVATKRDGGGGRDAVLIPLCVNTSDVHRRVVWEAWQAEGRCGRWSALTKAGIEIRALPPDQLDGFETYRPARPLQERWVPIYPLGTSRREIFDPEDPVPPEVPQPAKAAKAGRAP